MKKGSSAKIEHTIEAKEGGLGTSGSGIRINLGANVASGVMVGSFIPFF